MLLRFAIILSLLLQGLLADAGGMRWVRVCPPDAVVCAPSCCDSGGDASGGGCCCSIEENRPQPAEQTTWLVRVGEQGLGLTPPVEQRSFAGEPRAWPAPALGNAPGARWVSTPERLSLLCVRTT